MNKQVSTTTIANYLKELKISFKRVALVQRNAAIEPTMEERRNYSYWMQEKHNNETRLVYLDETGFKVITLYYNIII